MTKKSTAKKVEDDPRYHDTWQLLKKYRDVVWSLELSVQQLKKQFEVEYGSSMKISWNLSIWPALIWVGLRLRIMHAALSRAKNAFPA